MFKTNYWRIIILSIVLYLGFADDVNSSDVDQAQVSEWSQTVGLIVASANNPKNFGTFFVCESETGVIYNITAHHILVSNGNNDHYTTATAYYNSWDASRGVVCNVSRSLRDYDVVNFYPDSSEFERVSEIGRVALKYSDLDSATDIHLLDEVIYFGFPHGIGASTTGMRNDPVVRKTVVSYISTDGKHFLIQSLSGKGSSGSPVFSLRTNKIVGMVVAAYGGTDLTEVLRADRIRELLKR